MAKKHQQAESIPTSTLPDATPNPLDEFEALLIRLQETRASISSAENHVRILKDQEARMIAELQTHQSAIETILSDANRYLIVAVK